MEGGGDMGSFEAGALKAFIELLPAKEVEYDVVTGVSVGSINLLAVALHAKGDEKECVNWMNSMWLNLTSSNIYSSWPLGVTQGLLLKEGIFNNAVELEFLTSVLEQFPDKKLKRMMEINTVDIDTGKVVHFNENESWETLPSKVVSSTAMPFAFPHSHLDGHTYIDGGSVWNLDVSMGINRCLETHKAKDIIIDVLMCDGLQKAEVNDTSDYNTMQNYGRYKSLRSYYGSMSDLDEIIRGYPSINFRYLVFPTEPLPSGFIPLGFVHENIVEMIDQGYRDAKKVILDSPNGSFDKVRDFIDKTSDLYNPEKLQKYKTNRV
jgi:predicted patatin/cPLA2 family phospholipase